MSNTKHAVSLETINTELRMFRAYCAGNYEVGYLERLLELHLVARQREARPDRTGVGRHRVLGGYLRHNTGHYGPAFMLSKRVFPKGVFAELAWFLRGETNIKSLLAEDVHIWDEWADENGELGPIYGHQWRNSDYDQIHQLLLRAMALPNDSGNIVSAWNVGDLGLMALRPCHTMWQVCIHDGYLDLMLYQRSADWFLGVPFNAASYTSLQCLLAHLLGLKPGTFHHYFGDTHIYANQVDQVAEQLSRIGANARAQMGKFSPVQITREAPSAPRLEFPSLAPLTEGGFNSNVLRDIRTEDFALTRYNPEPAIKAPVAV